MTCPTRVSGVPFVPGRAELTFVTVTIHLALGFRIPGVSPWTARRQGGHVYHHPHCHHDNSSLGVWNRLRFEPKWRCRYRSRYCQSWLGESTRGRRKGSFGRRRIEEGVVEGSGGTGQEGREGTVGYLGGQDSGVLYARRSFRVPRRSQRTATRRHRRSDS